MLGDAEAAGIPVECPRLTGDTDAFAHGLFHAIARELRFARSVPQEQLLLARTERFRAMPVRL